MDMDSERQQKDHDLLIEINTKLTLLFDAVLKQAGEIERIWVEIDKLKASDAAKSGFWNGARWMWGVVGLFIGSVPPSVLAYILTSGK